MARIGTSGRCKGQAALVAALAGGKSVRAAAESSNVSLRTAHRRLREPAFRAEVAAARHDLIDRAVGRLAGIAAKAAATLAALLSAEGEAVRRAAAVSILDNLVKLRTAGELEERLQRVEELLREGGNRGV